MSTHWYTEYDKTQRPKLLSMNGGRFRKGHNKRGRDGECMTRQYYLNTMKRSSQSYPLRWYGKEQSVKIIINNWKAL